MADRAILAPELVITAGSMSGSLISKPTITQRLSLLSYQATWSGTSPVGAISVQGSNNYSLYPNGAVNNAGTWTLLPLTYYNGTALVTTTAVPVTGDTGSGIVDVDLTGIYALRLLYTFTSGTGTLNVTACGKVS